MIIDDRRGRAPQKKTLSDASGSQVKEAPVRAHITSTRCLFGFFARDKKASSLELLVVQLLLCVATKANWREAVRGSKQIPAIDWLIGLLRLQICTTQRPSAVLVNFSRFLEIIPF